MTEIQAKLMKMYEDFRKEIKGKDIDWVLYAGNALGAIREETWIPWDDDLDLAIGAKDRQKFIDVFKDSEAFELMVPFTKRYGQSFIRLHSKEFTHTKKRNSKIVKEPMVLDVFTIYNRKKPKKKFMDALWTHFLYARNKVDAKKKINVVKAPLKLFPIFFFRRALMKNYKNSAGEFPFEDTKFVKPLIGADVTDTIEVNFAGVKSPVFRRYDEYFTSRYDENWRIPHEEHERWTHKVDEFKGME